MQYNIIFSHHAIHYVPITYTSYTWKFVSFDQHLPIPLPAHPKSLATTILLCAPMSLTILDPTYKKIFVL